MNTLIVSHNSRSWAGQMSSSELSPFASHENSKHNSDNEYDEKISDETNFDDEFCYKIKFCVAHCGLNGEKCKYGHKCENYMLYHHGESQKHKYNCSKQKLKNLYLSLKYEGKDVKLFIMMKSNTPLFKELIDNMFFKKVCANPGYGCSNKFECNWGLDCNYYHPVEQMKFFAENLGLIDKKIMTVPKQNTTFKMVKYDKPNVWKHQEKKDVKITLEQQVKNSLKNKIEELIDEDKIKTLIENNLEEIVKKTIQEYIEKELLKNNIKNIISKYLD